MIRSGLKYDYGIGFWGPNGHDAIWHLALINQIKNPFKIPHPTISGQYLENYHPFYDIFIATLSKITFINPSIWLFQLFPILSSVIFLLLSFKLGKLLTKKFSGGIYLVLLNTFATSFGWVVTLIKNKNLGGESLFWAMQSFSNQLNPPFIFSLLLILICLIILKKKPFLLIFLSPFIPITKSYGGVVFFAFFFIFSFLKLLKKQTSYIKIFTISFILSILLFLIYNKNSTGLFIFKPFWFIHSMIESADRFYLPKIANMRYSLLASDKVGPRLITIELVSLVIFILGNFGYRTLFLFKTKLYLKNIFTKSILFTILFSLIIPIFFIQKGTAWNTIQFLYYSLFFANILLAITLSNIKKKRFNKFIIFAIFVTSFIANLPNYKSYLGNPAPASLPTTELEALNFLKKQPGNAVLTYPYDKFKKSNLQTPIPLYLYETTAYVPAFTGKQTFLSDEMNLSISGYDWKQRRQDSDNFFSNKFSNIFESKGFLLNNNIDYIYLTKNQNLPHKPKNLEIEKIYDSDGIRIYQIQK